LSSAAFKMGEKEKSFCPTGVGKGVKEKEKKKGGERIPCRPPTLNARWEKKKKKGKKRGKSRKGCCRKASTQGGKKGSVLHLFLGPLREKKKKKKKKKKRKDRVLIDSVRKKEKKKKRTDEEV